VTLGVEDREAWLCRVPLTAVAHALHALPIGTLTDVARVG
jgi:hypothetical protein